MRDQIIGRLVSNNWTMVIFGSARKSLIDEATDEEIISLIEAFPKSLRHIQIQKRDEQNNLAKDAEGKQICIRGIGIVSVPREINGEVAEPRSPLDDAR